MDRTGVTADAVDLHRHLHDRLCRLYLTLVGDHIRNLKQDIRNVIIAPLILCKRKRACPL